VEHPARYHSKRKELVLVLTSDRLRKTLHPSQDALTQMAVPLTGTMLAAVLTTKNPNGADNMTTMTFPLVSCVVIVVAASQPHQP
jgi:hypothetical protein